MTGILLLAIAGALIIVAGLMAMLHRERTSRRYIHGKTLADDRLCEVKGPVFATVFLNLVDCPKCLDKVASR